MVCVIIKILMFLNKLNGFWIKRDSWKLYIQTAKYRNLFIFHFFSLWDNIKSFDISTIYYGIRFVSTGIRFYLFQFVIKTYRSSVQLLNQLVIMTKLICYNDKWTRYNDKITCYNDLVTRHRLKYPLISYLFALVFLFSNFQISTKVT